MVTRANAKASPGPPANRRNNRGRGANVNNRQANSPSVSPGKKQPVAQKSPASNTNNKQANSAQGSPGKKKPVPQKSPAANNVTRAGRGRGRGKAPAESTNEDLPSDKTNDQNTDSEQPKEPEVTEKVEEKKGKLGPKDDQLKTDSTEQAKPPIVAKKATPRITNNFGSLLAGFFNRHQVGATDTIPSSEKEKTEGKDSSSNEKQEINTKSVLKTSKDDEGSIKAEKMESKSSEAKPEKTPAAEKKDSKSSEIKQEKTPAAEKKDSKSSEIKQEKTPAAEKKDSKSSEIKQEKTPAAEKKDSKSSEIKQEKSPAAEEKGSKSSETKPENEMVSKSNDAGATPKLPQSGNSGKSPSKVDPKQQIKKQPKPIDKPQNHESEATQRRHSGLGALLAGLGNRQSPSASKPDQSPMPKKPDTNPMTDKPDQTSLTKSDQKPMPVKPDQTPKIDEPNAGPDAKSDKNPTIQSNKIPITQKSKQPLKTSTADSTNKKNTRAPPDKQRLHSGLGALLSGLGNRQSPSAQQSDQSSETDKPDQMTNRTQKPNQSSLTNKFEKNNSTDKPDQTSNEFDLGSNNNKPDLPSSNKIDHAPKNDKSNEDPKASIIDSNQSPATQKSDSKNKTHIKGKPDSQKLSSGLGALLAGLGNRQGPSNQETDDSAETHMDEQSPVADKIGQRSWSNNLNQTPKGNVPASDPKDLMTDKGMPIGKSDQKPGQSREDSRNQSQGSFNDRRKVSGLGGILASLGNRQHQASSENNQSWSEPAEDFIGPKWEEGPPAQKKAKYEPKIKKTEIHAIQKKQSGLGAILSGLANRTAEVPVQPPVKEECVPQAEKQGPASSIGARLAALAYGSSQPIQFGGGPKQPSKFGGGPRESSKFGGGPRESSKFGGGPREHSKFGGGPRESSKFGGGPNQHSKFGGGPKIPSLFDNIEDENMFPGRSRMGEWETTKDGGSNKRPREDDQESKKKKSKEPFDLEKATEEMQALQTRLDKEYGEDIFVVGFAENRILSVSCKICVITSTSGSIDVHADGMKHLKKKKVWEKKKRVQKPSEEAPDAPSLGKWVKIDKETSNTSSPNVNSNPYGNNWGHNAYGSAGWGDAGAYGNMGGASQDSGYGQGGYGYNSQGYATGYESAGYTKTDSMGGYGNIPANAENASYMGGYSTAQPNANWPAAAPPPPPAPEVKSPEPEPPAKPKPAKTGASGSLLHRLDACAIKNEKDMDLAVNVVAALLKSLKDYNHQLVDTKNVEILTEAAIKFRYFKPKKSAKDRGASIPKKDESVPIPTPPTISNHGSADVSTSNNPYNSTTSAYYSEGIDKIKTKHSSKKTSAPVSYTAATPSYSPSTTTSTDYSKPSSQYSYPAPASYVQQNAKSSYHTKYPTAPPPGFPMPSSYPTADGKASNASQGKSASKDSGYNINESSSNQHKSHGYTSMPPIHPVFGTTAPSTQTADTTSAPNYGSYGYPTMPPYFNPSAPPPAQSHY